MKPDIKDPKLAEKAREMKLEQEVAKARESARVLKKKLKIQSKSQLIMIIFDYASRLQEIQQAARQLLAENKKLKGIKNETSKSNKPNTDDTSSNNSTGEESK